MRDSSAFVGVVPHSRTIETCESPLIRRPFARGPTLLTPHRTRGRVSGIFFGNFFGRFKLGDATWKS